jgi:hypothetical protein
MGQLNVKIPDETLAAVRLYASRSRTPITWLVKDYLDYLVEGGTPIHLLESTVPSLAESAALAAGGSVLAWLKDEPDLYTLADCEEVFVR